MPKKPKSPSYAGVHLTSCRDKKSKERPLINRHAMAVIAEALQEAIDIYIDENGGMPTRCELYGVAQVALSSVIGQEDLDLCYPKED